MDVEGHLSKMVYTFYSDPSLLESGSFRDPVDGVHIQCF